ncbi:MAG: hypothetical protein KIT84_13005 [Labilithrix sp.]|nr:hypothetical protein [Labilithrix sp.]MCW5811934.1 hypothetical protein [Labilithrix sp.]
MPLKRAAAVFALTFSVVPSAYGAPPSAKQACIAAHEEALTLKSEKKPHAAKEKFVACARAECPVVVRKECGEQIDQMSAAAPTVALEALDDKGNSDTQVKVTLDGIVVADKLTGSAIDVEPGEHLFVFERGDGKKIEQKLLVVEGEKNRKVVADYQTLLPKPPPVTPPPPPPPKKMPILAYVAGGVALAAVGSFAFFSISGKSKEDDLATSCSPNCGDGDVASVRRSYVIADVSLGVGIFATAAALVLALPALTSGGGKTAAAVGPAPWMPRVKVLR